MPEFIMNHMAQAAWQVFLVALALYGGWSRHRRRTTWCRHISIILDAGAPILTAIDDTKMRVGIMGRNIVSIRMNNASGKTVGPLYVTLNDIPVPVVPCASLSSNGYIFNLSNPIPTAVREPSRLVISECGVSRYCLIELVPSDKSPT